MADLLEKCSVCRALIDEEDLFCANCGTEAPHRETTANADTHTFKHNFECQGCGASMSYDAEAQTLACPFCGSEQLEDRPAGKSLGPNRVVPFAVDRDSAVVAMRKWLGKGFWRPSDLSESAAVTKMTAVYVPYWVFTARTFTYWTADSSKTPFGARGDWVPLSGEHRGQYSGVLIGASSVLTPSETSAICPFDIGQGISPSDVDLQEVIVEQFRVQRKYARPLAKRGLENFERQACEQYVPGRCRNLKVNVRMEGLSSDPVLLPVWVMAYRYQDRVFRFLLNGQSGRATGQAPTSWKKVVIAILVALLIAFVLMLLAGGIAAMANAQAPGVPNGTGFAATSLSVMMASCRHGGTYNDHGQGSHTRRGPPAAA